MQKFVDRSGRIWVVHVDVASIKRTRTLTGINLLDVVDGELIERFTSDPVLLADVLFAVCKPQADSQNVSDESFGEGLAGDVIADATVALIEGLVAFFPEPRRRLLQKAAAKYQTVRTKGIAMIEANLENPELEQKILSDLQTQLDQLNWSGSFTDSQALSESTQGH
ncbi:MAG: hypothetical protein ACO1RT_02995 [Planctomycetaceae bacterium]